MKGVWLLKLVQHNHPDRKIRASWVRLDIHRLFHCQPLIKHHQPVDQLGVVSFVDRRIVFRNFSLCCSMSSQACLASWSSATKSFRPSTPLVWPFDRSCFLHDPVQSFQILQVFQLFLICVEIKTPGVTCIGWIWSLSALLVI